MKLGIKEKNEIIELLRKKGINQNDLAQMMLCPRQSVNRSLGSGTLTKKFYTMAKEKIAEASNDSSMMQETTAPPDLSAMALDLARQIAELPHSDQRAHLMAMSLSTNSPEALLAIYKELVIYLKAPTFGGSRSTRSTTAS